MASPFLSPVLVRSLAGYRTTLWAIWKPGSISYSPGSRICCFKAKRHKTKTDDAQPLHQADMLWLAVASNCGF